MASLIGVVLNSIADMRIDAIAYGVSPSSKSYQLYAYKVPSRQKKDLLMCAYVREIDLPERSGAYSANASVHPHSPAHAPNTYLADTRNRLCMCRGNRTPRGDEFCLNGPGAMGGG